MTTTDRLQNGMFNAKGRKHTAKSRLVQAQINLAGLQGIPADRMTPAMRDEIASLEAQIATLTKRVR